MRPKSAALFLLFLVPLYVGALETEVRQRVGYAYDPQSGRLLYTETHNELFRGDDIIADLVVYRDTEGAFFAEKRIDFTDHVTMPDFHLTNVENGHVEAAAKSTGNVEVSFRKLRDTKMERRLLELPGKGIVDAGFDRFIDDNWDSLSSGETLVRNFLVPSRLDFYEFRIRRAPSRETDGEMVFLMEMDSMFVRMFVPPVTVSYDADTRRLRRYEGVSNIRNRNGENYSVRIEFPSGEGEPVPQRTQARATRVSLDDAAATVAPLRAP